MLISWIIAVHDCYKATATKCGCIYGLPQRECNIEVYDN